MRTPLLFAALLFTLALKSYAIQVEVNSSAKEITGLGFTVNGEKFGGMGNSYTKKDAPKGVYSFGLRANKDIACKTKEGKRSMTLNKDTVAQLSFDGKKCKVQLSSAVGLK